MALLPVSKKCNNRTFNWMAILSVRYDVREAKESGDRIHSDLWGPAQVEALARESYVITFANEAKAWSEIEGLRLKSDAFFAYKAFKARLLTQRKVVIKELHCDGGGELVNKPFNEY